MNNSREFVQANNNPWNEFLFENIGYNIFKWIEDTKDDVLSLIANKNGDLSKVEAQSLIDFSLNTQTRIFDAGYFTQFEKR